MSQYYDQNKGKSTTGNDPNRGNTSGNNNRNKKKKEYSESIDMEPSLAPSLSLLSHQQPQSGM